MVVFGFFLKSEKGLCLRFRWKPTDQVVIVDSSTTSIQGVGANVGPFFAIVSFEHPPLRITYICLFGFVKWSFQNKGYNCHLPTLCHKSQLLCIKESYKKSNNPLSLYVWIEKSIEFLLYNYLISIIDKCATYFIKKLYNLEEFQKSKNSQTFTALVDMLRFSILMKCKMFPRI